MSIAELPEEPAKPVRYAIAGERGGARRDRTDDLMLAKHALYQLSYGPMPEPLAVSRRRFSECR